MVVAVECTGRWWRWCRRLSCIRIWTKSITNQRTNLGLGSYTVTVGGGGNGGTGESSGSLPLEDQIQVFSTITSAGGGKQTWFNTSWLYWTGDGGSGGGGANW